MSPSSFAISARYPPIPSRYYGQLVIIACFLFPTAVPVALWGESAWIALYAAGFFRLCAALHGTWFINSAAHT